MLMEEIDFEVDALYTCGAPAMLKAVAKKYEQLERLYISMESRMACGIGACLCCVNDTKEGHKCVCTDGPVFNINDLKWQI